MSSAPSDVDSPARPLDGAPVHTSEHPLYESQSGESSNRWLKLLASTALSPAALMVGMLVGWWIPAHRGPVEIAEPTEPEPTYVSSVEHRNEPLQPLKPYEGLEPSVVELGRRLFHDRGLSGDGKVSCVACHQLASDRKVADKSFQEAGGEAERLNIPTLLNSGLNFVYYSDGRASTIQEQLDVSITSSAEMNSDWKRIETYLRSNPSYVEAFQVHLGGPPTRKRITEAMVSFQRSLITLDSPLDQWLVGTEQALNTDQFNGYFLFKKHNCISCHTGPAIGGQMYQPLAKLRAYFEQDRKLGSVDFGRYNVTESERDRFVFRVPSLRNVALTPPYFHDGSAESLDDAVAAMLQYNVGIAPNPEEVRRLVEFLKALNGKTPRLNREAEAASELQ